jgi:hypothetical protein
MKSRQAKERARLRGRVKRLERCLKDVQRWISDEYMEARSYGRNTKEDDHYSALLRLDRRVRRTMPPIFPRGLYTP